MQADENDGTPGEPDDRGRRRWLLPAAAVLAVAVIGAGAFALGRSSDDDPVAAPTTTTVAAPASTDVEFVTHRDEEAGFSVQVPRSWTEVREPEGDVRLVLQADGLNSLLIRATQLEQPVTSANIGDLKAVTDAIVSGAEVRVLKEAATSVNGMAGYYYLYTFTDAETSQEGVHAHYFLFRDRTMYALVFQALPADAIGRLEPVFDRIRESFRSIRG